MARIAIVDDSVASLELLQAILKDPHQVITYSDPREFIRDFHRRAFDLILLDLAMPEMDGFETFYRIRDVDNNVPVGAVTANACAAQQARAFHAGFCDYFIKPLLDIACFRQTVYSWINSSWINSANPSHDSRKQEPAA